MTFEELSRVSQAMGIQSDLLCFFLSTSKWIRSLDSPFVTIRVRYGRQYLYRQVYGWTRRMGARDFWQQGTVAKQDVIFAGSRAVCWCIIHRIYLNR
jgi:hypothetical protein